MVKLVDGQLQGFPDGATFDESPFPICIFSTPGLPVLLADNFDIGAFDVAEGDLRAVGPPIFFAKFSTVKVCCSFWW